MPFVFLELLLSCDTDDDADTMRVFVDGDAVIEPGVITRADENAPWAWAFIEPPGGLTIEALTDAFDEAEYRGSSPPSRASVIEDFRRGDFVGVSARWEQDGRPDQPIRWQAWSEFADRIIEDANSELSGGELPRDVASRWYEEPPDDLDEWPLATLREIADYCEEYGCTLADLINH